MPLTFLAFYDPEAWRKTTLAKYRATTEAAVGALRDVATDAVKEGRSDIARASPGFAANEKWQKGLRFRMQGATEGGEPSLDAKAIVFHKIGLASLFEYGATIHGKPLLWIPVERGAPPPKKSGKKLTFATINGTPVAFDAADKDRHRRPIYIGTPQAVIPKKFHITEIVKEYASRITLYFIKRFKDPE